MTADQPFKIRPVEATDEVQWRDIWHAYLAFYATVLPEDTYSDTFARILGGDHDMYGYIAMAGGDAIGLVDFLCHRNFWKPTQTRYLQDLFTTPATRGKGIARALIHMVFAAAVKQGIPDVYWLTAETNYAGRMLYDRVGVKTPFIVYKRTH